jgi:putative ABC transport system permease protein
VALLDLATVLAAPLAQARYGLALQSTLLAADELPLLGAVIATGLLVSLVPGYRAYRLSLADGLTPRL